MASANRTGEPRPFGWRDKLGNLLGDMGNDFTYIFAGNYLLKFYTDELAVAP